MIIMPKAADLHDLVATALRAGRDVTEAWSLVDIDVGADLVPIRDLIAELGAGEILEPLQETRLVSLETRILGHFGRHCPEFLEIARKGEADSPLPAPHLESVRQLWCTLRDYRHLRQRIFDDIKAEQLIAKLRRNCR